MPKVSYIVVSPEVQALFTAYGLGVPTGNDYYGQLALEQNTYYYQIGLLYTAMNNTFYDENPDNDAPDSDFDILEKALLQVYWSSEGHFWYPKS